MISEREDILIKRLDEVEAALREQQLLIRDLIKRAYKDPVAAEERLTIAVTEYGMARAHSVIKETNPLAGATLGWRRGGLIFNREERKLADAAAEQLSGELDTQRRIANTRDALKEQLADVRRQMSRKIPGPQDPPEGAAQKASLGQAIKAKLKIKR